MQHFIPGQRCISDSELQQGLGTVLSVEQRRVTVLYAATGETRIYARETAPLTRVAFAPGDVIQNTDGYSLTVYEVVEEDGLLFYVGTDDNGSKQVVAEGQLNSFLQLNRPTERLFNGQIDRDKWFELRCDTFDQINRLMHSDLYGLTGCRTSLIPHQLYIAHEVANRYAPRILLADEVGLGKTIEAGLILQHQLLTDRARRALIVVPESLLHQWLVEMLRRFNLRFSIFDEERCTAICESTGANNPFQAEQLVLCSLSFLKQHPRRFQQSIEGNWDLLIVDEAHHLQWSENHASEEYLVVQQLAQHTAGVLLLTATPEQLGKQSHFARLRLLDPERFPDYRQFIEEEAGYQPYADVVQALLERQPLDESQLALLRSTLAEGDNRQLVATIEDPAVDEDQRALARYELVEHLLDRHGTGRVLFRNTRAAVQGFAQRRLHHYPLPLPAPYEACTARTDSEAEQLITPERIYRDHTASDASDWTTFDPRVVWLQGKLTELRPEKVVVIAASAKTALDLAAALKQKYAIHAAVFHEGMSIVERDRAAAFFADRESGSQILVCSEIGSEGRNFQFAHHLVLFDLPLNPDLLEQRIGRLDRIGQTQTIKIHVPCLADGAQEILYRWYHEGLNAFENTCPAGHEVFSRVEPGLRESLSGRVDNVSALIDQTANLHRQLDDALKHGRDRLLEYNSCRPRQAETLRERAQRKDQQTKLPQYMEQIYDCYGIDTELHSEDCWIVRPSEHMVSSFPGLPDEGMTITYQRDIALANEDMQFFTWEHPFVRTAMDMVATSELGNSALTAVKYKDAQTGTLLLECQYILEAASGSKLQSSRYLPPTVIRIVVDEQGRDHAEMLTRTRIQQAQTLIDQETASKVVRVKSDVLRNMLEHSEAAVAKLAPELLAQARQQATHTLDTEINRLRALARVNPNIRSSEVEYFESQLELLSVNVASTKPRLDAVRVIVSV